MKSPIVIAHRGASAYAPENTMSAFRKAIEQNAQGIELDVHLSRDGQVVVAHDENLKRTCNGTGWIKDKTVEELKSLDFGSWFSESFKGEKIPLLTEVMDLVAPWGGLLNIEIKCGYVFYEGIEKKVADIVNEYNMVDRVIVSSFNHYVLYNLKKIEPRMKTGLLYYAAIFEPWKYAAYANADAIHPLYHAINADIVKNCRENGIMVNPFTIDAPELIKTKALEGVDGIITNVPDVALNVVNELK